MTVIKTCLGRYFDLAKPREQEYPIEEIAWHLAHINRFTGAAEVPVSVAYHSVRVSNAVPPQYALAALLHDAEEAYYGDISSPAKKLVGAKYRRLAEEARLCALEQNGVTQEAWDLAASAVHKADAAQLRIEVVYFTHQEQYPHPLGFQFEAEWWNKAYWAKHRSARRQHPGLNGPGAAEYFLGRYYELIGAAPYTDDVED
jgi:hypothetical protein